MSGDVPEPGAQTIEETVEAIRRRHGGDPRLSVFDVEVVRENGRALVRGDLTDPVALRELGRALGDGGAAEVATDLRLLPVADGDLPAGAVVAAMVAPMLLLPDVREPQVSQAVLGTRLGILRRWRRWYHARTPDGYLGWVHRGYLEFPDDGKQGKEGGASMVSLGTPIRNESGASMGTLPWGARVVADRAGRLRLPNGTRVWGTENLFDPETARRRYPPDPRAVTRTALTWMGSPYLWGGVTPAGVDCSGLVQTVFGLHGVELPRDSDLQAKVGEAVDPGADFRGCEPGDLLFFAEETDRITHVTLSLGGGRIVHASLGNGGVATNDLAGDLDYEVELREIYVCARRLIS